MEVLGAPLKVEIRKHREKESYTPDAIANGLGSVPCLQLALSNFVPHRLIKAHHDIQHRIAMQAANAKKLERAQMEVRASMKHAADASSGETGEICQPAFASLERLGFREEVSTYPAYLIINAIRVGRDHTHMKT